MNKTFLDKIGLQKVAENVNTRLKTVSEMPVTPELNMVRMYKGEDTEDFKKGHTYQYNGTSWTDISGGTVEQIYNSNSINAQSGSAIDMAISKFITDNTSLVFENKTWYGLTNFYPNHIWTDGTDIYYSVYANQYVLDKSTSTWEAKTWSGTFTNPNGSDIWCTENNVYLSHVYSSYSDQYILNKATGEWEVMTWHGLEPRRGNIWTDGTNIYYSDGSGNNYVLDEVNATWEPKIWHNGSRIYGYDIWYERDNIYCSIGSEHYALNKATDTWEIKTWNGVTEFRGQNIATDGNSCYVYYLNKQYVLDITTDTWVLSDINENFIRNYVWTDGTNMYISNGSNQYVAHRVINANIQ